MLANNASLLRDAKCSRAGCSSSAEQLLDWRNPKVHAIDRVKTWAACAAHTAFLSEYLSVREFLIATRPIDAPQVAPIDSRDSRSEEAR